MSRRPNHVIIQDVLQGTCISFLWLQQQLSAPNQTTLDPTARLPLKVSASNLLQILHTQRKGKFRFTRST